MTLETSEILLRLAAAALCGTGIGFNRDSKDKPAGMRTLGLVALSAALVVVTLTGQPLFGTDVAALSRVSQGIVQGVLAGVGFIGAGVVLHSSGRHPNVHGVTTAATVWLAAVLGLACGFGAWVPAFAGLGLTFVILVIAKPVERWILHRLGQPEKPAADDPPRNVPPER